MSNARDVAGHLRYFQDLGVEGLSKDPAWRRRTLSAREADAPAVNASDAAPPEPVDALPVVQVPDERLRIIRADIGDCTRCKLHSGRTNIVFGVGSPDARLMFVGEGPGADEDEQGEPFVGRAGQLLTQIIKAMGLSREDVYIANVVKCRPPGNRNPEPDEIAECSPFLEAQIQAIRPVVIVALGKFAAQTLLQTETPISRLRGQFHQRGDTVVMPTFHPSYLLRNPASKREVWEDMKLVMKRLTDSN
jgi:uracil-DNA glycosylase family 4